ncbi:hypothetical protein KDN24_20095 [Bacillus sp. Bva_UNVM-123]|uniref:hypothetical protein n=1 Tax=Bacillus sp. Bva_UNVM-123 TaxID=2829798 RepID=UPI00391F1464
MKRKKYLVMTVMLIFCSITPVSAQKIHYKYDELNRLVEADVVTKKRLNYVYDIGGNLLEVNTSSAQTVLSSMDELSSLEVSNNWNPYATNGVTSEYRLLLEKVNQFNENQGTVEDNNLEMVENIEVENELENEGKLEEDVKDELQEELKSGEESEIIDNEKVEEKIGSGEQIEEVIESGEQVEEESENRTSPHDIKDNNAGKLNEVQQISAISVQPGGANIYRDFHLKDHNTYTIKGWVKAEELERAAIQVVINYYDINNMLISHENIKNILEPTDWIWIDSSVTPPIDSTYARVHLQILFPNSSGLGTAKFSGITLEKDSIYRK